MTDQSKIYICFSFLETQAISLLLHERGVNYYFPTTRFLNICKKKERTLKLLSRFMRTENE